MTYDEQRLKKRVGWLNNQGGFENTLIYTKIAEAGEGLPDGKIMEVLKHLEDSQDNIWEPMRWVVSSLNKAHSASESSLDAEFDQALRRRIRWLNNEGGFENKIMYSNIAEAASGIEQRKAMEVLRNLEDRWEYVSDPTAWVCSALRKAVAEGDNYAGGYSSGASVTHYSAPTGKSRAGYDQWADDGWSKPSGYRADETDIYTKLWRRISWLNGAGGFSNSIDYARVEQAAEGADPSTALDLLNTLEENWQSIGNPTSWLCSSLANARGAGRGKGGGAKAGGGKAGSSKGGGDSSGGKKGKGDSKGGAGKGGAAKGGSGKDAPGKGNVGKSGPGKGGSGKGGSGKNGGKGKALQ